MPRTFYHATAEQTVSVTEAVQVNGASTLDFIEKFCDLASQQATAALGLAEDLGLVEKNGATYRVRSQLARFLTSPDEKHKSSLLRVTLESYEPFTVFRTRLKSTDSAVTAAQQTKALLDLSAHREEIKDTLISLGTYTSALRSLGGGRYTTESESLSNQLLVLAQACNEQVASEARIRAEIGEGAADNISRADVLLPLASALMKAAGGQPAEAVQEAGRAVESYLVELAGRLNVNLANASGINSKLDRFRGNQPTLPSKIVSAAKYLGHIRNAADHGTDIDPDVGAVWRIQNATALQYVFVACSFIAACASREASGPFII